MKLIIGFALCFSIVSFSQDTKFISRKNTKFVEEYYVLKADNTTKEGTYVKYKSGFAGISVLESGAYRNGNKDGLWEYYYDVSVDIFASFLKTNRANSLKEKGNYVNGKKNGVWITFYLDAISNTGYTQRFGNKEKADSVSLYVEQRDLRPLLAGQYLNDKKVGEWISFNLSGTISQKYNFLTSKLVFDESLKDSINYRDRPPLYVGGFQNLERSLIHEFDFNSVLPTIRKDSSTVVVEFLITEHGKMGEIKLLQSSAPAAMRQEVLRTSALLDNNWIPAQQSDHRVSSNYKLKFTIVRKINDEAKRESYTILVDPI